MMEILIKKVLESAKPPKGFLGTVRAEELHARLQMDSTENNFTSHYQDIIADISARLWKDKIRKVDIQGTKYPFSPETILQVLSSLQEN